VAQGLDQIEEVALATSDAAKDYMTFSNDQISPNAASSKASKDLLLWPRGAQPSGQAGPPAGASPQFNPNF